MNIIEELVAILGFETRGEQNVERFKSRLESAATAAANVARRMALIGTAVATAAAGATAALFRFVSPIAREFDQLANVATRLGVGVEPLQEMRYAAEQAGIGVQNFDVALRRFIRRSSEAAQGGGAAAGAFKELGIALKDNQGELKNSEDLLGEVADAIMKTENQADRLRLAFRFFDTDGAAMVQMLENGSEGLQQFYQEARDLGIVMGEDAVKAAAAYSRELTRLQRIVHGIRNQVALALLPAMTQWLRAAQGWIRANREIIQQNLDRALQLTVRGIETVGKVAMSAGRAVAWLSGQIEKLTGVGSGGQVAAVGLAIGGLIASRHPFLAAMGGLLLIVDDLVTYMDGSGESVLGRLMDFLGLEDGPLSALIDGINSIGATLGTAAAEWPVAISAITGLAGAKWAFVLAGVPFAGAAKLFAASIATIVGSITVGGLTKLALWSGALAAAVASGGLLGAGLVKNAEGMAAAVRQVGDGILGTLVGALETLEGLLTGNLARASEGFATTWRGILNIIQGVARFFGEWGRGILQTIDAILGSDLLGWVESIDAAIIAFARNAVAALEPVVAIWNRIVEAIQRAVTAVREFFGASQSQADTAKAAEESGRAVGGMVPPAASPGGPPAAPTSPSEPIDRTVPSSSPPGGPPAAPSMDELRLDLENWLRDVEGAIGEVSGGIERLAPGDVILNRQVDFTQNVTNNITQNVTGQTAPAAAGNAAEQGTERAGRRAADIAAQEPSLN